MLNSAPGALVIIIMKGNYQNHVHPPSVHPCPFQNLYQLQSPNLVYMQKKK
jgi:hypothetical protein